LTKATVHNKKTRTLGSNRYARENAASSERRWNDNIKANLTDIHVYDVDWARSCEHDFEISGLHGRRKRSERLRHSKLIKLCLFSLVYQNT